MSAYQIWNVTFKDIQNRNKFEKIAKKNFIPIKRLFQYKCRDCLKNEDIIEATYCVGCLGYAEGRDILKQCSNKKIDISDFFSIDLSCLSNWYDEKKQEGKYEN